jgi:iron complex transport system ATP-binding protein
MTVQIEARHIAFSYSQDMANEIFRDISFAVHTGDVFCMLGPNGTGKSTLLKCLCRVLHIRQGRIILDGRNLSDYKLPEIARKIAYVPQGLTSAFPFQVRQIVIMGRAPHLSVLASPARKDMKIAYASLETVGAVHLANRPCNTLSGGEWQLTLLARALAQEAQILLLDEPTSHLDMGNQMKILRVIKDLAAVGTTVIMASHSPDQAFLVANVAAILNRGQISLVADPDKVITEESMKMTYGVDTRVMSIGKGSRQKICFPFLKGPD